MKMTKIQKKRIREFYRLFDGPGQESEITGVEVKRFGGDVKVVTWGRRTRDGGYLVKWSRQSFRRIYIVNRRGRELLTFPEA